MWPNGRFQYSFYGVLQLFHMHADSNPHLYHKWKQTWKLPLSCHLSAGHAKTVAVAVMIVINEILEYFHNRDSFVSFCSLSHYFAYDLCILTTLWHGHIIMIHYIFLARVLRWNKIDCVIVAEYMQVNAHSSYSSLFIFQSLYLRRSCLVEVLTFPTR